MWLTEQGARRSALEMFYGILWGLRSGAPWRDPPVFRCPYTTCCNRFERWRRAGVCKELMNALTARHDAAVQTILKVIDQKRQFLLRNRDVLDPWQMRLMAVEPRHVEAALRGPFAQAPGCAVRAPRRKRDRSRRTAAP